MLTNFDIFKIILVTLNSIIIYMDYINTKLGQKYAVNTQKTESIEDDIPFPEENIIFKYFGENLNHPSALDWSWLWHYTMFCLLNQAIIPETYNKYNLNYIYSIFSFCALLIHVAGCSWLKQHNPDSLLCPETSKDPNCNKYWTKQKDILCYLLYPIMDKHMNKLINIAIGLMVLSTILIIYFIRNDFKNIAGKLSRSEQRKLYINNSLTRSKINVGLFSVSIISLGIAFFLRNRKFREYNKNTPKK